MPRYAFLQRPIELLQWCCLVGLGTLFTGCGLHVEPYNAERIERMVTAKSVPIGVLGDFYHFRGTFPVTLDSTGRARSKMLENNFFFLPVELNGAEGELLIDTGAPFAVVQPSFAERAGIPITEDGFLWTLAQFHPRLFELRIGLVEEFRAGTAVAENVPVLVPTDQVRFRLLGISTGELGGLLGWANLRNLTTTFDFERGTVTLDRRPYANTGNHPSVPVKIYNLIGADTDKQGIYVDLSSNGVKMEALFDTGSGFGLVIPEDLAEPLGVTRTDTPIIIEPGETGLKLEAKARTGRFDLVVLSLDVLERNGFRQVVLDMVQQRLYFVR